MPTIDSFEDQGCWYKHWVSN